VLNFFEWQLLKSISCNLHLVNSIQISVHELKGPWLAVLLYDIHWTLVSMEVDAHNLLNESSAIRMHST